MQILRLNAGMNRKSLESKEDCITVNLNTLQSLEEAKLALYLAKKSFKNKKNIARKLKYEFLLWLSGKTNIKSAINETAILENEDFFLITFDQRKLIRIGGIKPKSGLKKDARPLDLERISLSRVKN